MDENEKMSFSQRLKNKYEAEELAKHGIEIVEDPNDILGDIPDDDSDVTILSPGMLPPSMVKASSYQTPPAPKGFHYEDGILMVDDEPDFSEPQREEIPQEETQETESTQENPGEDEKSNSNLWADSETREFDFYNSKITRDIPKNVVKFLFCLATSYDYTDNNEKAQIVSYVMRHCGTPFEEVGTGTNRIAFAYSNYVYKVALDRRGLVDNASEFMTSPKNTDSLAISYDTNIVVLIQQYCITLDYETFRMNKDAILQMCESLANQFIIGDMGYTDKNFYNIGMDKDGTPKVVDYAYIHSKFGNQRALTCPRCNRRLKETNDYTGYRCPQCNTIYPYMDIKRRLNRTMSDMQSKYLLNIRSIEGLESTQAGDQADDIVDKMVAYVKGKIKEETTTLQSFQNLDLK